MPVIKSLEDLQRFREAALEKNKVKTTAGIARVAVAMGTCGVATGARDTMEAFLNYIEQNNVRGVIVTQTGCIGMCSSEPIVRVTIGEQPNVTYGKVTPDIAERIMKEHVQAGKILTEFLVPA
jgi:NADP-reducing hydrogenase subunit HndB